MPNKDAPVVYAIIQIKLLRRKQTESSLGSMHVGARLLRRAGLSLSLELMFLEFFFFFVGYRPSFQSQVLQLRASMMAQMKHPLFIQTGVQLQYIAYLEAALF